MDLPHDNLKNVVPIIEGSVGTNDATSRQGWIRKTVCPRVCTLTKDYWAACQFRQDSASFDSSSAEWSGPAAPRKKDKGKHNDQIRWTIHF